MLPTVITKKYSFIFVCFGIVWLLIKQVMIVMELMGLGDLNTYLWKNYVVRYV